MRPAASLVPPHPADPHQDRAPIPEGDPFGCEARVRTGCVVGAAGGTWCARRAGNACVHGGTALATPQRMKAREPLRYEVGVTRRGPLDATVEAAPRPDIGGGPPPEFGGNERAWSPEHLLVASAALCYWNTLEWFGRRRGVAILGFECRAEGAVEKTAGGLVFTSIRLHVVASTVSGQELALRELVQTAKDSCLVARSLACPVELVAEVRAEVQPDSPVGRAAS